KNSHPLSSMLYSMGIREKYVKTQLSLRNKTDLSKEQYSVLRTNNPDEVEELEQKFVRAFEFSPAPTVRSSFLTKLRMIGDNLANTPKYGLNERGELGLIKSAEFFENERKILQKTMTLEKEHQDKQTQKEMEAWEESERLKDAVLIYN